MSIKQPANEKLTPSANVHSLLSRISGLYCSLRFWLLLLVFFYFAFVIISSMLIYDGLTNESFLLGALALALMPLGLAYTFVEQFHLRMLVHESTFVIVTWVIEFGVIAFLRVKSAVLSRRVIIVLGTAILLLLVSQFAGCTFGFIPELPHIQQHGL